MNFLQGLLLLFVGLKLGGVIDWSWWAVLTPALVPAAIAGFFLCYHLIETLADKLEEPERKRPWDDLP